MSRISRSIARIIGYKSRPRPRYWQPSYSQEGEDLVLLRLFDDASQRNGFYIDVGAHHPARFSNTRLFYDLGWTGISIDPRPGFADEFLLERPNDIAIEAAVALTPDELTYYMFDESALNGFDQRLSDDRNANTSYNIIDQRPVQVRRLDSLLEQHVSANQSIDFMSIDVEGFDYEVVQSNDWNRFRPRFVLVEIFGHGLEDVLASESARFLAAHHYQAISRTRHTVFFEDRSAVAQANAA